MEVNILITSVSRKVWLVKAFKDALDQEGVNGKVVSIDMKPLSAGLYLGDKYYLVPPSSNADFIPTVLDICRTENVNLVIPSRDGELQVFAESRKEFAEYGVQVMVSDPEVIEVCNDKYRFYQFLQRNDIPTPETYLPSQNDFSFFKSYPLLIKSRYGSGSEGTFKVKNKDELNYFTKYVSNPLIQEFIGGKEYTIDLFSDFNGKVITVVPRERIEVVSGESYKGKTIECTKMIELAGQLAERLGTIGHITIQGMRNNSTIKFIEVNPRFGGGAMLGIIAGANTPLLLIELILGKKLEPQIGQYKKNLVMLRYTTDLFMANGKVVNKNDPSSYF